MSYLDSSETLLVLIGPSAVGKTTIAERLSSQGLLLITPSWTTRHPRAGERSDFEHVFCDAETFESKFAAGFFIDTAKPFNDDSCYGLPHIVKPDAKQVPAILLRAMVLPKLFKHYRQPIIYQIESPKVQVEQRLKERAALGANNADRLTLYDQEIQLGRQAAKRCFVNTDLDTLELAIKTALFEDFTINS
jgi:guanylate kinase